MVSDIYQSDQILALVEPYHPDIHIDREFKQVIGALDTLGSQRGVEGISGKYGEFSGKLFFLDFCQVLEMLLEPIGKGDMQHHSSSSFSIRASMLVNIGCLPERMFSFNMDISFCRDSTYSLG